MKSLSIAIIFLFLAGCASLSDTETAPTYGHKTAGSTYTADNHNELYDSVAAIYAILGIPVCDGTDCAAATYSDIVGLFGSGSCSGYLKSDGTCDTSVAFDESGDYDLTGAVTATTQLQNDSTDKLATTEFVQSNNRYGSNVVADPNFYLIGSGGASVWSVITSSTYEPATFGEYGEGGKYAAKMDWDAVSAPKDIIFTYQNQTIPVYYGQSLYIYARGKLSADYSDPEDYGIHIQLLGRDIDGNEAVVYGTWSGVSTLGSDFSFTSLVTIDDDTVDSLQLSVYVHDSVPGTATGQAYVYYVSVNYGGSSDTYTKAEIGTLLSTKQNSLVRPTSGQAADETNTTIYGWAPADHRYPIADFLADIYGWDTPLAADPGSGYLNKIAHFAGYTSGGAAADPADQHTNGYDGGYWARISSVGTPNTWECWLKDTGGLALDSAYFGMVPLSFTATGSITAQQMKNTSCNNYGQGATTVLTLAQDVGKTNFSFTIEETSYALSFAPYSGTSFRFIDSDGAIHSMASNEKVVIAQGDMVAGEKLVFTSYQTGSSAYATEVTQVVGDGAAEETP